MPLTFRLETFGGLAVVDDAGNVVRTQRRRLALLALIAAAGRRGISRDRILAYLWPESSAANARHGLEQLVYALRRQLGVSLFPDVDPLRLNEEILTSDVADFDEALERGDVASALTLYRGPFLNGFYLGDSGEFERWAEGERTRLAQRYAVALEQVARHAQEAGDAVCALEHWRKLVALDPVNGHATLALMNALIERKEAAEAIRHGRAYEALARSEGVEPAPAVSALMKQLLAERPVIDQPAGAQPLATPTGRESRAPRSRRWQLQTALAAAMAISILLLAFTSRRERQRAIVVVGSGDAAKDIPAIQAAVDGVGEVALQGHFSLDLPPTKPVDPWLASGWYPAAAEIRISKTVTIFGLRDARGEMPTIQSGTIPFYIDAAGERVTIRGLRFLRPTQSAILVRAVEGLEVSSVRIEGLVPFTNGAAGISINTRGEMPLPASPGKPEDVSGNVLISNNDIDASGGTSQLPTAGVNVFAVGQTPYREVHLDVISNRIRNTTAPAINIRRLDGHARVVGNSVQTSVENVGDIDAVRFVRGGSILMANNVVECRWPNAAAIQVYSPFREWPTTHVTVEDNTVIMAPSPESPLGDFSGAISVRGYAQGIVVRRNLISGRARAALSMYTFRGGTPADIAFIDNRLEGFKATLADIIVGSGVARSRIVGSGSVLDYGTATSRER